VYIKAEDSKQKVLFSIENPGWYDLNV